MILVDGNNVMGAAPDGWWRDPPAGVRRLLNRIRCYAAGIEEAVTVVLDVPLAEVPEGNIGGLDVLYATRRGRNAADDRIVEILECLEPGLTEVVTSDRELAERARLRGAQVTGARTFLDRLRDAGC